MQPAPRRGVNYETGAARGLAITQLVLGCLCVIIGIVAHAMGYNVYYWFSRVSLYSATGFIEIWTPIPFIAAGVLGILAASQRTHGMISAHLVLSIIATVGSFVLFVCACVYASQLWTHIVLAVLSFVEFVVAIMSAVFCCRATCCGTTSQPGIIMAQPQGVIVTTSGPPGAVIYPQQYVGQQVIQPGMQPQMQQVVYPPTVHDQYRYPTAQYATPEYTTPAYAPPADQPMDNKPPQYGN